LRRAYRTRGCGSAHSWSLPCSWGVCSSESWVVAGLRGRPALTGKEGMIGEVGTVRSPVGVSSSGWIFVHGELWRAMLAFAPEETDPRDGEPMIGFGRKVSVVGFDEGGVV
jgi:membrane-bound ClpP family serine protease